jgi:hypothetical protein
MHESFAGSSGNWSVVATIEVEARVPLVMHLPKESTGFRMMQRVTAPQGYAWVDICVDLSSGMLHAAQVARTVLAELASCNLAGFRVISGEHYLTMGSPA